MRTNALHTRDILLLHLILTGNTHLDEHIGYVIEELSPPGLKKSNLAEFSQGETEKSDLNSEFRGAGVAASYGL